MTCPLRVEQIANARVGRGSNHCVPNVLRTLINSAKRF
jgi:hypothetical protein